MAKKKTTDDIDIDQVDMIKTMLQKQYGFNLFKSGDELLNREQIIIPVSPSLDIKLGGGIPQGTWTLISGKPKVGKTTTALKILANAQKLGFPTFYDDIEGRLKKMNLTGISGLDPNKLQVIQSEQGHILDGNQHLTILTNIIKNVPNAVILVDSFSALCPSDRIDQDVSGSTRSTAPRLISDFVKQMGTVVPVTNAVVIGIQHIIANTSGFGSPAYEDSGNKIIYQADIRLRAKTCSEWAEGDRRVGQIISWEILCSALGQPCGPVDSYLRYGEGLDYAQEIVVLATDFGIIEKGGAWFTLPNGSKIQGMAKLLEYYKSQESELDLLYEQVKNMI